MTEVLKWSQAACKEAAWFGLIYVLEQQKHLKVVSRWTPNIWDAAAENGQVDVLHWALQQPFSVRMDPRRCLIIAAEHGHPRCCMWIFRKFSHWFRDNTAVMNAAFSGNWAAVKVLCTLYLDPGLVGQPTWQLDIVLTAAAAQGNLDFIQWAWNLETETLLREPAIAQAAANGNFHVLEWVIQEQLAAHKHLLWKIFAVAIAHQKHSFLRRMASMGWQVVAPVAGQPAWKGLQSLSLQANVPLEQLAMSLTPATQGDPLWQLVFKEALGASPWEKPPSITTCMQSSRRGITTPADAISSQQYADMIFWLTKMARPKRCPATIQKLVEESQSIVPIQLAAKGFQPRIPWWPQTHRLAAAHANRETLDWMLQQKQKPSLNTVDESCSPARMLRLVEQHEWSLPGPDLQRAFKAALAVKQRCLAFWGVVHHQRKHQPRQPCLGSLEHEHLVMIAQKAGLDLHLPPSTSNDQVRGRSRRLSKKRKVTSRKYTHPAWGALDPHVMEAEGPSEPSSWESTSDDEA